MSGLTILMDYFTICSAIAEPRVPSDRAPATYFSITNPSGFAPSAARASDNSATIASGPQI